MTSVELKILQRYDEFNTTERKIADYFLAHVEGVFHQPISQLAAESGVSQAAWVRFSKSIGYSGLKDLKKGLFDGLNTAGEDAAVFTDIQDYEDLESLSKAIKSSSVQAIEDTFQVLDTAVLAEVARLIIGADTVRLFGVGASATVAEDFYTKLMRIGKNVLFHYNTHFQLSYAANAGSGDVALFISHTGTTVEVLETLDIVHTAGARTVSLTRLEANPLAKRADLQLYTKSPEIYYRSGAMSSRLAQLFVIDVLYTAIANRNYEHVIPRLQKSQEVCSTHRVP